MKPSHSEAVTFPLIIPEEGKQKRVFIAGKGGVGKTTMACTTALYSAQSGFKTLLITTDPAAHLSDVLGAEVSASPQQIVHPLLFAARIDPKTAFERYKQRVVTQVRKQFGDGEALDVVKEELESPCTEEIAVFQEFLGYLLSDEYAVIVFDTAPTGHTLRLVALAWEYEDELSHKDSFTSETAALDQVELARMRRAIALLQDPVETTVGFVTLPESTPIAEMQRAMEDLQRAGIPTNWIVINQMLPDEAATSRVFGPRLARQRQYVTDLKRKHYLKWVTECERLDDEVTKVELEILMQQILDTSVPQQWEA